MMHKLSNLKRIKPHKLTPFLVVLPSIILVGVFVYLFIGWTGYMSVIDWNSIKPSFNFVGWENYQRIFTSFRFQSSMRNMLFFSIFFIAGVVISGLSLAIFLDRKVRGKWIYRNIFLFPMALSFVVTGIAWRWILNPAAGVNIFLEKIGISPQWYTDTAILFGFDLD